LARTVAEAGGPRAKPAPMPLPEVKDESRPEDKAIRPQ